MVTRVGISDTGLKIRTADLDAVERAGTPVYVSDLVLKVKLNMKFLSPLCWWWCHTVDVSFHLLDGKQRFHILNWRIHIWIHRSIILSSGLHWPNCWCLNTGFFLQTPCRCPCPVSCPSHKLLTLRNSSSESVVAFCLSDLFLSELPQLLSVWSQLSSLTPWFCLQFLWRKDLHSNCYHGPSLPLLTAFLITTFVAMHYL